MTARKLTIDLDDRDLARSIAGALQDLIEPTPDALTVFENGASGWRIEAYYGEPPHPDEVRAALAGILGREVPQPQIADVPDLNWVALSQAALPPVHAGRFMVHGSHDRHRVPQGPNAILIDAGEAFGTAHHATTHGCLLAVDRLTRRTPFRRVLDLGCGSGVLAIAAARALPRARIIATDIDTQSVLVARENMRANGVGGRIRVLEASGLDHPLLRTSPPFDLVIANILADPLIMLAPAIARATRPGSAVALSGLLIPQAREVTSAYLSHGFALAWHWRLQGWSTLVLERRGA